MASSASASPQSGVCDECFKTTALPAISAGSTELTAITMPDEGDAGMNGGMTKALGHSLLCGLGLVLLSGATALADVPLDGRTLQLIDSSGPEGRRNQVALVDAAVDLSGLDPTVTGATLYLGPVDGPATVVDLPAAAWNRTGNAPRIDFKYKSSSGAVRAARLIDGRSIRLTARGPEAYALNGLEQGEMGVVVEIGGVRFCGTFGGRISRNDGLRFVARDAPAPASCPTFGVATTTTTSTTTSSSTTTTLVCGTNAHVSASAFASQYASAFDTTSPACQTKCDADVECQCFIWGDVSLICTFHTAPCNELMNGSGSLTFYSKGCPGPQ